MLSAFGLTMVCVLGRGAGAGQATLPDLLRIENQSLIVRLDTRDISFKASSRESGLAFVQRGAFATRAERLDVTHPTWGRGGVIEVTDKSGATDRLALFPELPFLVFGGTSARSAAAISTF